MRKSGNFGRTLNSGDKEGASSTRVDLIQHQRMASGGNAESSSKRQLFGGKDAADTKAKKSDSESYEASYGYDDEVSYYSDD